MTYKVTSIFYLYLFSISGIIAQVDPYHIYYQQDLFLQQNKIKSSLDRVDSMCHEYDTLGRETSWYYAEDSVKTHFVYSNMGDTLLKTHFNSVNGKNKPPYQYEKFLYNGDGQIRYYSSCNRIYESIGKTNTDIYVDKFVYTNTGQLVYKYSYFKKAYPSILDDNISLVDSLLILDNVYKYSFNEKNQLIEVTQSKCRNDFCNVDSFFYDAEGRLFLVKKYFKMGFESWPMEKQILSDFYEYNDSVTVNRRIRYYPDSRNNESKEGRVEHVKKDFYSREGLLLKSIFVLDGGSEYLSRDLTYQKWE